MNKFVLIIDMNDMIDLNLCKMERYKPENIW